MTSRSTQAAGGRPTGGARSARLPTRRAGGERQGDHGQGTLEYVGVVAVAVLLVAALLLAASPAARAIAARIVCEVSSLGQAACSASSPGVPDADSPDGDEPSWWCKNVGWFCSDDEEEELEDEQQDDGPGWWCETLGWFCADEPEDDPTSTPTATPTGHPTDPANGLPVVDGVTIPEGLDPDGETVRALLMTERGRELLQWLADNGIEVFDSSRGSYWDGENIYLDTGKTPLEAVRTLVHELEHAQADTAGETPDIFNDSREDYVNGMLDEEARGVVAAILAARELEDAGVDMPTDTSDDTYWDAYDAAVEAGRSTKQARDEAFAAVRNLFLDGTFVTSNTGDPYDEYYGDAWDNRN